MVQRQLTDQQIEQTFEQVYQFNSQAKTNSQNHFQFSQITIHSTYPYPHHKTEQFSFCFDPLQLYPSFIFLVVMYLFSRGDTCSVIDMLFSLEGLVRLCESSMQSENLRAMFERIRHMSTSLFYCVTPYDHFYSSQSRMGIVQFQDFALCCHRNFYSLDEDLLVSFFTTYLSLRKFFIASATVPAADTGGSLSIMAFGCSNSIFCNALVYSLSCFYSSRILLSLILISSLSLEFSSLNTTNLSKMSEICFLVGDLASCQSFNFSDSLLISFCRSVMIISYLRLVLASLYLMHLLIDPSSSDMIDPALEQRLVRFVFYYWLGQCFFAGELRLSVIQSITVSRKRLLPPISAGFYLYSDRFIIQQLGKQNYKLQQ